MAVTDRRSPALVKYLTVFISVAALLGFAPAAGAEAGAVGEPAPAFEATDLATGEVLEIADLEGQAVLVNKWSTWCRPCVAEMPFLQELHDRYAGDGFQVVGISIDVEGSDGKVTRVADDRGVTYPIWLDPEDAFTSTFRSSGVPESVLLDRDGIVVRRWPGALVEQDETIAPAIERALKSEGDYRVVADEEVRETSGVRLGVLGLLAAVLAGLLSFLSPCVLPLVPSYVAFLAGVRGRGEATRTIRRRTLVHAVAFVIGFSAVFVALGASATALGGALRENGDWLARGGGTLLIVMGIVLLGMVPLAFLQREVRFLDRVQGLRRIGPVGSALVGVAFGAGWTPCIGPVLAGVLALAATSDGTEEGIALLAAYSAGLAIPFLGAALAVDRFISASGRIRRWMPWVNRLSGVLLIALGILLVTGAMTRLSGWFAQFTPTWLG